jgi:hypothetical protein
MRSATPQHIYWKKSSYSAADGNCVEVARLGGGYIGVRDSKNPALPVLGYTAAGWRTFITAVKTDRQPLPRARPGRRRITARTCGKSTDGGPARREPLMARVIPLSEEGPERP